MARQGEGATVLLAFGLTCEDSAFSVTVNDQRRETPTAPSVLCQELPGQPLLCCQELPGQPLLCCQEAPGAAAITRPPLPFSDFRVDPRRQR